MSPLSSGAYVTIANDKLSCTIRYEKDGNNALGVQLDYIPFSLTFAANGGSGSMSPVSELNIDSYRSLPQVDFTRTGYHFNGWTNVVGKSFADKATVSGTDLWNATTWSFDAALSAKWAANTYRIAFDGNGATSGSMSALDCTYDQQCTLTANAFAKSGWAFVGWSKVKDGAKVYDDKGTVLNLTSDNGVTVTLYAIWRQTDFTVTYQANGGSFADGTTSKSKTVILNQPYGDAPGTPTRGGYTFGGWWTRVDGGSRIYPDSVFTDTGNLTFYAHWDSVGMQTVNVSWQAIDADHRAKGSVTGGGSYNWGSDVTLQATPSTGSKFVGWTDGVTDNPRTVHVTESGKTYTAKFDLEVYRVTFNYKNASGNDVSETQDVKYGYSAIEPAAAKTGYPDYAFTGWSNDRWKSVDGTLEVNANYASTVLNVTFDANGGTVTPTSMKFNKGGSYANLPTPSRSGYNGTCWWTGQYGGSQIQNGSEVTLTGVQTLYAHWTAKTFTVTLNANGGTVTPTTKEVTFDGNYGSLPTPTWRGHAFVDWFTTEAGGQAVRYDTKVTTADNHTLWAHWTEKTYTVTLDRQGGEGGSVSVVVKLDQDLPVVTVPTRTGYDFGGYFAASGGGGAQYYTADGVGCMPWTEEMNRTIYAKWTKKTFVLTLDRQGGSGGAESVTATYGETLPSVSVPTREGYLFGGYFELPEGGGKQYYSNTGSGRSAWEKEEGGTLYAKWTLNSYTVAFDSNGATNWVKTQTLTIGDASNVLASNEYAKTGYTFTGWADSQANARTLRVAYADGAKLTRDLAKVGETNTLWAVWNTNTYWIAFDANGGTGNAMLAQEFKYDVPRQLSNNTYAAPEHYEFLGWSAVKTASMPTYTDGETVVNLCAEDGRTNTLYAVWKFIPSPLSEVLDCTNLYFTGDASWEIVDRSCGHPFVGGDCLCHSNDQETAVSAKLNGPGTLSFCWLGEYKQVGLKKEKSKLTVSVGSGFVMTYEASSQPSWSNVVIHVDVERGSSEDLSFSHGQNGLAVWLDHVTWTPDESEHPEPTDADKVTISTAGVTDGKFTLSFTSDERFDYNLLTNANLLIDSWGKMEKKTGTGGAILFEPEMIDGLPQLFYKVETIQRQD